MGLSQSFEISQSLNIATRAKTNGIPENQKTRKVHRENGAEKVFCKQFVML